MSKEAVKTSKAPAPQLQITVNQVASPAFICGPAGSILSANGGFAQLSRYNAQQVLQISAVSLFDSIHVYNEILAAARNGHTWEGHTIFLDAEQDEFIARLKTEPLDEGCLQFTFFDVARSRKNTYIEAQLLKAIARCTETLFHEKEVDTAINKVLDVIGRGLKIDRCYIFENKQYPDGQHAERQYLWAKRKRPDPMENPIFASVPYASLPDLYEILSQNQDLSGTSRGDYSPHAMEMMRHLGTSSFLFIPIFKDDTFWGFIGFDDCENLRQWTVSERSALRSLASNIGAFLKIDALKNELINKNIRLENAIEGSRQGLWVHEVENSSLYVSPRVYEMFGYTPEELTTDPGKIFDLLKTEASEQLEEQVKEAIEQQRYSLDFESVLRNKQGNYVWVKGTVNFFYDDDGLLLKNSGVITDITIEKNYELRIRKNEEYYQRLVNSLREVVFETDKNGGLIFLNNSWKNLTGFDTKDSLGKKLTVFLAPSYRKVFNDIMENLREKQAIPGKQEFMFARKNGQKYWTEISVRGKYDSNYKLTGISGSIFDINQSKAAERRLRESEERYRLISENTKDIICLHEEDGKFTYVSPSVHDILGLDPEKLIGTTPWNRIHPDDLENTRQLFKNVVGGDNVGYARYRIRHLDNSYIWVETIASQQVGQDKNRSVVQTSTRDVTQQKQAEEEIKNALEKERQLIELRTNLVNMVSHEFRTPLTTIKSSTELLDIYLKALRNSEVKEKFSLHFERIKAQVNRINELISGILLLGRVDAGKIIFRPEKTDAEAFIKAVLDDLRESDIADKRRPELIIKGKPRPVNIDPLLIHHIVINLISNALKYSQGKKNPELTLKFEKNLFSLIVKDYGIGISEEDQKHLFESFFRGENALTMKGTGIGLVIVKQFIDMHKGTIHVTSKLNKGTSIEVKIPV